MTRFRSVQGHGDSQIHRTTTTGSATPPSNAQNSITSVYLAVIEIACVRAMRIAAKPFAAKYKKGQSANRWFIQCSALGCKRHRPAPSKLGRSAQQGQKPRN